MSESDDPHGASETADEDEGQRWRGRRGVASAAAQGTGGDGGGAGGGGGGGAGGASTASVHAAIAKRFRSLMRQYTARQREKSAAVLAANKAALEAFLPWRLASITRPNSQPIPKLGDVNTGADADEPGAFSPLLPPSHARPAGVLPLPLSERRAKVTFYNAAGGSIAAGAGGSGGGASGGGGQAGAQDKEKDKEKGLQARVYVRTLPPVQQPPSYTTWSYLKRNELARDHGRRMFLVDDWGETVPADDGDTEERLPWDDVDGAAIDWAMARLGEERGWEDPDLLEALMRELRPQPQAEALAQRLAYLQRLRLVDDDRNGMEVEEVLDAFNGSFCRRCRIYGCRTHSGGHVKPHQRPAPPAPDESGVPCGPGCWRLAAAAGPAAPAPLAAAVTTAAEAPAGAAGGAAAAAAGSEGAGKKAADAATVAEERGSQKQQKKKEKEEQTRQQQQSAKQDRGRKRARQQEAAGRKARSASPTPSSSSSSSESDAESSSSEEEAKSSESEAEGQEQQQQQEQGNKAKKNMVVGKQQETRKAEAAQNAAARGGGGSGGGGAKAQGADGGDGGRDLSVLELSMVKQGIQVFGAGNACMVAALVGPSRTCAEVHAAIQQLRLHDSHAGGSSGGGVDADGAADGERNGGGADGYGADDLRNVPARRKGARKKGTLLTNKAERSLVVNSRSAHGTADMWEEYTPCTCEGKCKADCPCVRARNFCEKFCACSTSCKERFRGCNCKAGCKHNACPCTAAGRECDPDLCAGCAPTLECRAELGRECHNMRLRMRQHAHVVLGTSDIPGAGWGLFSAQYVSKNGFLGEYTGDLITQDEANRRGSVYDHMNNSYLFNLNREWVVDAKFRGNKLRCANHSHEPVAKAKVLMVDGESRIAIFADKNVTPGMEITYDYRYSNDVAPHWVKKKRGP